MAGEIEELKFYFYLILNNLKLNSHMWLVALVLEGTVLKDKCSLLESIIIFCAKSLIVVP